MPTRSDGGSSAEMSFWSHLDVMRSMLVKAALLVSVLTVVLFAVMPDIFDRVIMAPCGGDFVLYRLFDRIGSLHGWLPDFSGDDFHVEIVNIKLASQFFIHVSVSFWCALVLSVPAIMYLLWDFVSPALYTNEKKGVRFAFLLGNVMFFLGVAVGYFVVFPLTLRFLADYHVSAMVANNISLDSYMDNFLMIVLMMGLVFELPLLAWLLGRMWVITRDTFRRYRRHAIVVLLVGAAMITPTGDPFTLMVVFLPIYFLWEFASLLVPGRKKIVEVE